MTTQEDTSTDNEIDLIEVIRKLWLHRKFILKVTLIFACLGILVALFSAKQYTATCTMVPQTGEKTPGGSLGGLAAMAGINLGSSGNGEVLSPKIYPKILSSVPFQKELMQTAIHFDEYKHPVSLLDYYTGEEYQKFSLISVISKYTIGLPGTIIGAFKAKEPEIVLPDSSGSVIQILSKEEDACAKILQSQVLLTVNDKEGYITLSANMEEPLAAAQLAAKIQLMLQKYITEFKIEKAQANLDFIEGRFAEAKQEFETKQDELAKLRDANRNFASAVARTTEERMKNEYDLAFGVYSELAKQREQAGIQVKQNTPVFAIVEPVSVPLERSKPKRGLICVAFTFLGGFFGIGLVLTLPFMAQVSGCKRLRKWLPEKC
ncbi:MAG: Wzz/FepE/Etk N-terminal domain-containing protein [Odoribacter sp.]